MINQTNFTQENKKEVIKELKNHPDNTKGVVTVGYGDKNGIAWLVAFILFLFIHTSAYGDAPRYIYNHPYYRSVKPSYNNIYVPSYGNYNNSYNQQRNYGSRYSQPQRQYNSPFRLGY